MSITREWSSPFNPFNSLKALTWPDRFEALAKGQIPNPVSVTIDPTNRCQIGCLFCQYAEWRKETPVHADTDRLLKLVDFLINWDKRPSSVCVAGGGEPLAHVATPEVIRRLVRGGIQVGMITNGILLKGEALEAASLCKWVGFSVDAAYPETYAKIKRTSTENFQRVCSNIMALANHNPRPSIGFKFLLQPSTINEIMPAATLAKFLGADDFHARPMYVPGLVWDKEEVGDALTNLANTRGALEDTRFHVYGITHKFADDFSRKIPEQCRVTPLAGLTFTADGVCQICCDLRGDEWARMCSWEEIGQFWGSEEHKTLLDSLDTKKCPRRCTYNSYEEILEQVFEADRMCRAFV